VERNMSWLTAESNLQSRAFLQRLGFQILMVLLFFYFSYSGASELGITQGLGRKFEGHEFLAKVMGGIELLGGLALLRPEGALGGACFLIVPMGAGLIFALMRGHTYAALECLLMLNVCILIAYWRSPKSVSSQSG
jgi:hypothetical protein